MPNFQQKTIDSETIWFDADIFPDVKPELFSSHYWQTKNALTGQAAGRGTTYFFEHDNTEYVLRHYRRGGLIGKVLKDAYAYLGLKRTRAWLECDLLKKMQTLDLPTPQPVAAKICQTGLYYRADIISTRIPKARDLYEILLEQPLEAPQWIELGKTIAKFHNKQVYHHDLNIHNIMLQPAKLNLQPTQLKAWLIDFDKCAIRSGESWKQGNLTRLHRSLAKEKALHNIHWQENDWQALLQGYES